MTYRTPALRPAKRVELFESFNASPSLRHAVSLVLVAFASLILPSQASQAIKLGAALSGVASLLFGSRRPYPSPLIAVDDDGVWLDDGKRLIAWNDVIAVQRERGIRSGVVTLKVRGHRNELCRVHDVAGFFAAVASWLGHTNPAPDATRLVNVNLSDWTSLAWA